MYTPLKSKKARKCAFYLEKSLQKSKTNLRIWLYLAKRSERQGAPVLICVGEKKGSYISLTWSPFHTSKLRILVQETYLSGAQTNHQVSYEGVFSFPRAMADHHTPAALLSLLTTVGECSFIHMTDYLHTRGSGASKFPIAGLRSQRLANCSNLVDFQQQAVAGFFLHGFANAARVGHCEVVSNHLDVCAFSEVGPGLPVILVKGILDRNHCVFFVGREINCRHASLDNQETLWLTNPHYGCFKFYFCLYVEVGRIQ